MELVAQHIADGADFALVAMALAQEPRIGIGTAIAIDRKFERDHRKLVEIVRDGRGLLTAFQAHTEQCVARRQRVALLLPALEADDDRAIRQGVLVPDGREIVRDELPVPNELHRGSP